MEGFKLLLLMSKALRSVNMSERGEKREICANECLFQHEDDYSVLFEDTTYTDGYSPPLMVAQRYVIACTEDKKK